MSHIILNIILSLILFGAIYLFLKHYNDIPKIKQKDQIIKKSEYKKSKDESDENIDEEDNDEEDIDKIKKPKEKKKKVNIKDVIEFMDDDVGINMNRIFYNKPIENKKIEFNYMTEESKNKIIEEQNKGINLNSWVPNRYIDHIDENGKPVYNTDNTNEDLAKLPDYDKDYKINKYNNYNGVIDTVNNQNLTIKEIYDNSIFDFKKLIPEKKIINNDPYSNIKNGASNLSYTTDDLWTYEDDKEINNGKITDELNADDPMANTGHSVF